MKLIRREQEQMVFQMSTQEKMLLQAVLSVFPQVPAAHHQLSQMAGLPNASENQRLLEEALLAQEAENQEWLKATVEGTACFQAEEDGCYFKVKRAEIETLLQIFNDVRIGSWLKLGSPALDQRPSIAPTRRNAPFLQRMELAGLFEMFFLQAIQEQDPSV